MHLPYTQTNQSAIRVVLRLLLPRQGPELPLRLAAHLVHAVERPLEGARGLVLWVDVACA